MKIEEVNQTVEYQLTLSEFEVATLVAALSGVSWKNVLEFIDGGAEPDILPRYDFEAYGVYLSGGQEALQDIYHELRRVLLDD